MVLTGGGERIPIKAKDLANGMRVPLRRVIDGEPREVVSTVAAVARSWDLRTVYWQLDDDPPDWCWATDAECFVTVIVT